VESTTPKIAQAVPVTALLGGTRGVERVPGGRDYHKGAAENFPSRTAVLENRQGEARGRAA